MTTPIEGNAGAEGGGGAMERRRDPSGSWGTRGGQYAPLLDLALRIADAFGVRLEEVFYREEAASIPCQT